MGRLVPPGVGAGEDGDRLSAPISRLLDVDDVAEALGFTPAKVRHLIRRGHLPTVAIGRRVYVPEVDLANLTRPGQSITIESVVPPRERRLRFSPKG